jgi:hypothetical protein
MPATVTDLVISLVKAPPEIYLIRARKCQKIGVHRKTIFLARQKKKVKHQNLVLTTTRRHQTSAGLTRYKRWLSTWATPSSGVSPFSSGALKILFFGAHQFSGIFLRVSDKFLVVLSPDLSPGLSPLLALVLI